MDIQGNNLPFFITFCKTETSNNITRQDTQTKARKNDKPDLQSAQMIYTSVVNFTLIM